MFVHTLCLLGTLSMALLVNAIPPPQVRSNTLRLMQYNVEWLFLDYNKLEIRDEEEWFKNIFVTGPGWQMAQKFVENVFETHVDWIDLINNDDNYKNILQVKFFVFIFRINFQNTNN